MSKVLAKVGDRELVQEDLQDFLASMPPEYAQQLAGLGEEVLVEELINQELIYQDALAKKLDESAVFKLEMDKLAKEVLKGIAINEVLQKAEPTEEEARQHYEENKELYVEPEKVASSHILVDTLEKAQEVKRLLDEGASFSQMAMEHSSCPSKENGGALGLAERGRMVPEFEDVAFALELNEISGPVESQFGFHIIQVDNKVPAGEKSYEEALPEIVEALRSGNQQELYTSYMEELREIFPVTK